MLGRKSLERNEVKKHTPPPWASRLDPPARCYSGGGCEVALGDIVRHPEDVSP